MPDIVTAMTNIQIAFGIATIALLLAMLLFYLVVVKSPKKR